MNSGTSFLIGAALLLGTALPATAASSQSDKAVATGEKSGRIATEKFGRRPFMQQPRLSPDGTKIAVRMGNKGIDYLGIIDLTKPGSKPEFFARVEEFKDVGDRTLAQWRWVGDRTVVMTYASRENIYGTRADLTRLVAYDLESKKLIPLAWEDTSVSGANILHVNHDSETLLLQRTSFENDQRAFMPEVVSVNVRDGAVKVIMRPNPVVGNWIVDGKGVVRASVGYDRDNGKTRIMYRSGDKGYLETVYNEADRTFSLSEAYPQIFLDEPDMALGTNNKDGFNKVYKFNMKTMEPVGGPIFEVSGYDVGDLIENQDGNRLMGINYVSDRPRTKWLDKRMATIQKFLDEEFGEANAQIFSSNRDYTKLLINLGGPDQAGSIYLYDVQSGDFQLLGHRYAALRDMKLNPMKTIRYKASDGETIEAFLTMPRHRPNAKKLPMVMITHGGPFGPRDMLSFDVWAQAIAEMGYVVVQPNYRGSGGYGREWIKKGRDNGFGLRMQDDLNDAVDHLANEGIVDPTRVCMMGWSYGGYASARAAQRDPDRWRCTIAGAGVYDLPEMRKYDVSYLGSFGSNYLAKGAAELTDVSPARNAKGKWSPILIVHGARDQRVPVAQAKLLVNALKAAGKKQGVDFEYVEQKENTHNFPFEADQIEWLESAEKWLAKHNPAYVESDADKPVPVAISSK